MRAAFGEGRVVQVVVQGGEEGVARAVEGVSVGGWGVADGGKEEGAREGGGHWVGGWEGEECG